MRHRNLAASALKPAGLFAIAAGILAVNGLIFLHAEWPPLTWKNVHFASGDFGEILLVYAAMFAAIALLYFALRRRALSEQKTAIGLIHFGLSVTAVLAHVFLDYWFSVTFRGNFWGALGASFDGLLWAAYIFIAAQLIFLGNLAYIMLKRLRRSGTDAINLSIG
jgi:hypothetical protein